MANLHELMPASFRGVGFLMPKGTADEGRHAVVHNYPDAAFRYVEDNGLIPPDFKVHAIVQGDDCIGVLNRLRAALNRPGPGTLMHPIYGRQIVQVVGPYHVKHDDKHAGVIFVDIHFSVTGPPYFPAVLTGIAAVIPGLASDALTGLAGIFSAVWAVPQAFAAATGAALASAVGTVANAALAAFPAAAAVSAAAERLVAPSGGRLPDGEALAAALTAIVEGPFGVAAIDETRLLAGFAEVGEAGRAVSAQGARIRPGNGVLAERQAALVTLGAGIETAAFIGLCKAAVVAPFTTAEDVAAAIATVADSHGDLARLDLDAGLRARIDKLLAETVAVLEAEQVTLPDVVTVAVHDIPASVLAYMLTDTTDDLAAIVALNDGKSPILFTGPVKVLRYA